MSAVDKSRRTKPQPRGGRATLLLSAALMTLAGCESDFGAKQGDPLVGIRAGTPAVAPGAGAAAQTASTGGLPPVPGSHTSPPLAAAAGGAAAMPLDPRSDLRMDTSQLVPVSNGAARGTAPSNTTLNEPEPVTENTSHRMAVSAPGSAAAPMTLEKALQYLKQRGTVWYRLETVGDGGQWRFMCSIRTTSPILRTYETGAPLPSDPLVAVQAVINQIDKGP